MYSSTPRPKEPGPGAKSRWQPTGERANHACRQPEDSSGSKTAAANIASCPPTYDRDAPRPRTFRMDQHGRNPTPYEKIVVALGYNWPAPTQFYAACPSCSDAGEHLSVGEGDDGKVLLKCFHDCEVEEICEKLGMEVADLFPRRPTASGTAKTKPATTKARKKLPAIPSLVKCTRKKKARPVEAQLVTAPGASNNWAALVKQYEGALTAEMLAKLANALRVPPESLRALHIGWCSDKAAYAFPEFNGRGEVIGINTRAPDGRKRVLKGSNRGLYLPHGWHEHHGPVLIVEGASDCAAATAMGLAVIGRPSATGGVEHLAELLADMPESREIIVAGELDAKSSGKWPGRDGAIRVAEQLAFKLGRKVAWALPPEGSKDLRAWLIGQKETNHG